jgi:hypothetical protein
MILDLRPVKSNGSEMGMLMKGPIGVASPMGRNPPGVFGNWSCIFLKPPGSFCEGVSTGLKPPGSFGFGAGRYPPAAAHTDNRDDILGVGLALVSDSESAHHCADRRVPCTRHHRRLHSVPSGQSD